MDILAAAGRYRMFEPGDLVIVAVSGGSDSVVMLHALCARASELGIALHVAHLNHQIRGEESNIDQDFVLKLAHQFGLPATSESVDVPALQRAMQISLEEAARYARYRFLQETYTKLGAQKIAVAHNANDRAESVLLNIIRGSGSVGLGSIRPVRENIVRPLIDTPKSAILDYIEENGLPFRIDESNLDTSYTRNRIRHELIPLLENNYNPRVIEALVRLADISESESDLLDIIQEHYFRGVKLKDSLDARLMLDLPTGALRRVIRAEIERCKGDLLDIGLEQVDRVIGALVSGSDFTITLPSGDIYAVRKGGEFSVRHGETAPETCEFNYALNIPGDTLVTESGLSINAALVDSPVASKLPKNEILIDPSAIVGNLRVRNIRHGDRMIPFGMRDQKKLQDIFVDKKISKRDRARAAVVVDDEKIIWVVGITASESARIAGESRNAIRLTAIEIEPS